MLVLWWMKKEVAEQTTTATIHCREPTIPSHRCAETYPLRVGSYPTDEREVRVGDYDTSRCCRRSVHTSVWVDANVCMYAVCMYNVCMYLWMRSPTMLWSDLTVDDHGGIITNIVINQKGSILLLLYVCMYVCSMFFMYVGMYVCI
jgi:hypothetical protein